MTLLASSRNPGRPKGVDSNCYASLLAVALSSFACHGYEGTSLRTIANSAGFNVSMVPHYFGSKTGLWQAVVDAVALDHEDMLNEFRMLNNPDQPITIRITRLVDALFDRLAQHPEFVMFVTRELSDPGERLNYLVEKLIQPSTETYSRLWREAMDAGLIQQSDPVLFHISIFGSLAMSLAFRPIIGQLGGREMSLEQLKDEIHTILNLTQSVWTPTR
jgi:TetR/AcrR family transcriptional regulator